MGAYVRPTSLDEALDAMASGKFDVLAGGTDYYPARVGKPLDGDVLDITAIPDLRGIADEGRHWRIGATTTWTDIIEANLPPAFDGLKLAAREVGGVQIQNAGTVAGNLCNASPAADGVPPLLALGAEVELASAGERRRLSLPDFILGNRQTSLVPGELVTAVLVPKVSDAARATFLKLGARRYLVISIVMVSVVIEPDASRVAGAGIAVGSCSAVAQRLSALETILEGQAADPSLAAHVVPDLVTAGISPITDVRGTADYRQEAAVTLVRRALAQVGGQLSETGGVEAAA